MFEKKSDLDPKFGDVELDLSDVKHRTEYENSINGSEVEDVVKTLLKPCIYKRR